MNRENKRKQYQRVITKRMPADRQLHLQVRPSVVPRRKARAATAGITVELSVSRHVDDEPGDRASDCGGIMDTIGVADPRKTVSGQYCRCRRCNGVLHSTAQQPLTITR